MKPKKCKNCQKIYQPSNSLQSVCSFKCAIKRAKEKTTAKNLKIRKLSGKDGDKLRRKADALFQEVGKRKYPRSIISGEPTQVIHHVVKKSQSNATRYYLPNGIPLTNEEHDNLHKHGESKAIGLAIKARGIEWFDDLQEKRKEICKLTEEYLMNVIERLNG
jgi:hypothetical protein